MSHCAHCNSDEDVRIVFAWGPAVGLVANFWRADRDEIKDAPVVPARKHACCRACRLEVHPRCHVVGGDIVVLKPERRPW